MLVVDDFVLNNLVVVQVFTDFRIKSILDDELLQENVFPKVVRDETWL